MPNICFPHYKRGEFNSLADVLKFLGAETYSTSRYALRDIVLYTPRYRSRLRRHGVDDLIVSLIDEAPALKDEPVLLHRLRRWAEECPLADYDIRCYNIKDKVTILGHTFNGLKDIRKHIETVLCYNADDVTVGISEGKKRCDGIHIGCYYENYAKWYYPHNDDVRLCESYIFRTHPISQSDMSKLGYVPHRLEFYRDNEHLSSEWLPILYYPGEGDYMFFATNHTEW
jgi:hypothetical protein